MWIEPSVTWNCAYKICCNKYCSLWIVLKFSDFFQRMRNIFNWSKFSKMRFFLKIHCNFAKEISIKFWNPIRYFSNRFKSKSLTLELNRWLVIIVIMLTGSVNIITSLDLFNSRKSSTWINLMSLKINLKILINKIYQNRNPFLI